MTDVALESTLSWVRLLGTARTCRRRNPCSDCGLLELTNSSIDFIQWALSSRLINSDVRPAKRHWSLSSCGEQG